MSIDYEIQTFRKNHWKKIGQCSGVQRGVNGATAPGIQGREGIKRVTLQKLHFIKLLKIYAFLYRKSTNICCMDLVGSCLGSMV